VGDFELTRQIDGFWDRNDIEIDLVAISDTDRRIRFGTCKRNAERLVPNIASLQEHVKRFLNVHRHYQGYKQELVAIAPRIDADIRRDLAQRGVLAQDLIDLTRWETPA
jgi:hypothetical protein